MKKILLISQSSFFLGGKARFTQQLYNKLDISPNYNVKLLNTIRSGLSKNGNIFFKLIRMIIIGKNLIYHKIKFIFLIISFKPDFIQIHTSSYFDFWDNFFYVMIANIIYSKKIIVRVGGGAFDQFVLKQKAFNKSLILKFFEKTDYLILLSDYWKKFFIENKIKTKNIFIIPNFVDIDYWNSRTFINNNIKIRILFMAGSNAKIKGYYTLLPAFEKLVNENYNIELIIVGLDIKLENKYQYLLTNGKIELIDYIKGEEKLEIFKTSDIFLLPTNSEGFPNSIIEAMAAKVPIISTNIPPISCIIENNTDGLLIEKGNCKELYSSMKKLIENSLLREKISQSGYEKCINKYNIQRIYEYLDILYN